jgi:ergothioneine biosynthesis protein EgtB
MKQNFPAYRLLYSQPQLQSSNRPTVAKPNLLQSYQRIREQTLQLCVGLSEEDCMVQSMPDASPLKWHLAHVTWFFETFILNGVYPDREPFHPQFQTLFNSYYVGVGARQPRPERGVLSRPSFNEVMRYRKTVDNDLMECLSTQTLSDELYYLVELGLHHEQQHQELILTDLKHHFWRNPLHPAYQQRSDFPLKENSYATAPMNFLPLAGGLQWIGHEAEGFCFDNEIPCHQTYLEPYEVATRLVTNAEYLAFIEDGGYHRAELWLSDGWDTRTREGWEAPLYWMRTTHDQLFTSLFTLSGDRPLAMSEPVCHISYYEADAYARWSDARLPTEFEWEHAARVNRSAAVFSQAENLLESAHLHPVVSKSFIGMQQLFGDVWEWTNSAYLPYPGFHIADGAVGEYNGKFMINQMVLRGGSCATPRDHIRASYRNFFPPHARWQFSGIRLARDLARKSIQTSNSGHHAAQEVKFA